jgi:hypothetical protein
MGVFSFCCCSKSGPPCPGSPATRTFNVTGCGAQDGATVVVTDAFGTATTHTTSGGGHTTFTFAASGAYTWTVDAPRFATASGSFTIAASCLPGTGPINVTLTPATGYHCLCFCAIPVADTLNMTDPDAGAVVLTYNPASGFWEGTASGTFAPKGHNDRHDGRTSGPAIPLGDPCDTAHFALTYKLGPRPSDGACALSVGGTFDYSYWSLDGGGATVCAKTNGTEGLDIGAGPSYVVNCTSAPVLTITFTPSSSGDFYDNVATPSWVWPTPTMSPITFTISE